jgi:signal transduction histidine kinase
VAEPAEGDDGRPIVRIVVEDEGVGFDTSTLLLAGTDGEAEADPLHLPSGIGLASVRERLELVGGAFRIWSAPGQGTRVTIEVPASLQGLGAAEG